MLRKKLHYLSDQHIDNLPNNLRYLLLGYSFNHSIDSLPDSITHLHLGPSFSQPVNKLPKNLIVLGIYHNYNFLLDIQSLTNNYNIKLEIY